MQSLLDPCVRPLRIDETQQALQWAKDEQWNLGAYDCVVFTLSDPESFVTIEVKGQPVGVMSAVRLTTEFGFVGFFVLAPAYRGSRHGVRLCHAVLDLMGDRTIGLDSVQSRVRNYSNWGFAPAHRMFCYQGLSPARASPWAPGIEPAEPMRLQELIDYDTFCFGLPRTAFLSAWLTLPERTVLVFRRAGRLCGFGVVRRCQRGVRIGPLHADDPEAAEALFAALAGLCSGDLVSIDCPETNPDALRLVQRHGLIQGEAVQRMYLGTPPPLSHTRTYGLINFSLG